MRPLIQRAVHFSFLATIVVIVLSGACGLCADDEHDLGQLAAEASHDHEAGVGHEHAASEHGDESHAEPGGEDFNQPDLNFRPKLFFWSLGLFLLFVFLARQFAWAPLIRGLDARESRVNRALHDAEVARVEAAKLLADHDARMGQVQDEETRIGAAARQEAEAEKSRIIAEADAEAAAMRDQAIAQIKAAHQQALGDLDAQLEQQVAMATDHVLGQTR